MGQAKSRGTFLQRQSEAYERIDKAAEGMTIHLKQLDEIEKASEKRLKEVATTMVTAFIENQENARKRRLGIRIGGNQNGKTSESD